jgi:hypothetical protein
MFINLQKKKRVEMIFRVMLGNAKFVGSDVRGRRKGHGEFDARRNESIWFLPLVLERFISIANWWENRECLRQCLVFQ